MAVVTRQKKAKPVLDWQARQGRPLIACLSFGFVVAHFCEINAVLTFQSRSTGRVGS